MRVLGNGRIINMKTTHARSSLDSKIPTIYSFHVNVVGWFRAHRHLRSLVFNTRRNSLTTYHLVNILRLYSKAQFSLFNFRCDRYDKKHCLIHGFPQEKVHNHVNHRRSVSPIDRKDNWERWYGFSNPLNVKGPLQCTDIIKEGSKALTNEAKKSSRTTI